MSCVGILWAHTLYMDVQRNDRPAGLGGEEEISSISFCLRFQSHPTRCSFCTLYGPRQSHRPFYAIEPLEKHITVVHTVFNVITYAMTNMCIVNGTYCQLKTMDRLAYTIYLYGISFLCFKLMTELIVISLFLFVMSFRFQFDFSVDHF